MSAQEHSFRRIINDPNGMYECINPACTATAHPMMNVVGMVPCPMRAPASPILSAEWEVDQDGYVCPKGGGAPLDISQGDFIAQGWAAAPDMARAMMLTHRHLRADGADAVNALAAVRAALLKAGVSEAELEAP